MSNKPLLWKINFIPNPDPEASKSSMIICAWENSYKKSTPRFATFEIPMITPYIVGWTGYKGAGRSDHKNDLLENYQRCPPLCHNPQFKTDTLYLKQGLDCPANKSLFNVTDVTLPTSAFITQQAGEDKEDPELLLPWSVKECNGSRDCVHNAFADLSISQKCRRRQR